MKIFNTNIKLFLLTLSWLIPLPLLNSYADSLEMESFYPIPYGNYDSIQLKPQPNSTDACLEGTLIVQEGPPSDLFVCQKGVWENFTQGSLWTYNDGYVHPTDTTSPENKKLGIGTITPLFQLTLEKDGGILIIDKETHTRTQSTSVSGTSFVYHRGSLISGEFPATPITIPKFSVIFGKKNQSGLPFTSILSGEENSITLDNSLATIVPDNINIGSVIASGYKNKIDYKSDTVNSFYYPNLNSIITGGLNNQILNTPSSVIGGGNNNLITMDPAYTTKFYSYMVIGAGGGSGEVTIIDDTHFPSYNTFLRNSTASSKSFIGGGSSNLIDHIGNEHSAIAGGFNNTISAWWPEIIENNFPSPIQTMSYLVSQTIKEHKSFILGGKNNRVSADKSVIGGGLNNIIKNTNLYSVDKSGAIAGGENNTLDLTSSTLDSIIGGSSNHTGGGGGLSNFASAGGKNNRHGYGGGEDNQFAWSGKDNRTRARTNSFIAGGLSNRAMEQYSIVLNGKNNIVTGEKSVAGGQYVNVTARNTFAWGHGTAAAPINAAQDNNFIIATGKVGINIDSPDEMLHISNTNNALNTMFIEQGTLILSKTAPGGANPLVISNGNIVGRDIAESFNLTEPVEPGDVLSLTNSDGPISLSKSQIPYDSKAIGIASNTAAAIFEDSQVKFSTKGADNKENTLPVALTGQVLCKVNLENGSIAPGDPLTTSSMIGYAMKATDKSKSFGTVIAKALEPFNEKSNGKNTGLIKVLVIKK